MIAADDHFTLEPSAECAVPGYLVLRLKGAETGLAALSAGTAAALGALLARAAKAIEAAVGAERVYVLSFCEVDPRLHFHLFPRSAWLLREYRRANGASGGAVDGPMLFSWARRAYARAADLPPGVPGPAAAGAAIRVLLERGA
jgi:diadenosine tetraphosphate (Ap4A) HIT family hydrolase